MKGFFNKAKWHMTGSWKTIRIDTVTLLGFVSIITQSHAWVDYTGMCQSRGYTFCHFDSGTGYHLFLDKVAILLFSCLQL